MNSLFMIVNFLLLVEITIGTPFNIFDYCLGLRAADCTLSTPRFAYGSAFKSNKRKWYMVGGFDDGSFSNNYLDTVNIITLPAKQGSITGFNCNGNYNSNLPQTITQSQSLLVNNNKLHNFGGFTGTFEYLDNVYVSNVNTQSAFANSLPSLPRTLSGGCSVTVNNKIYIVGGIYNGTGFVSGDSISNSLYLFKGNQNQFTELTPMNTKRFAPGCAYFKKKIYVFGGETSNLVELNTIEIYDIQTDTWTDSTAVLSYNAHWITSFYMSINNKDLILSMGGIAGFSDDKDNIDVYDIDNDQIIQSTNLPYKRYAFSALTSTNNKNAVIAGGKNVAGVFNSVDVLSCGKKKKFKQCGKPCDKTINVVFQVNFNDGITTPISETITITKNSFVIDVLKESANLGTYTFVAKYFGSIEGFFVECIKDVCQDTNAGLFYILYINNVRSNLGVSAAIVYDGDIVRFEREEF